MGTNSPLMSFNEGKIWFLTFKMASRAAIFNLITKSMISDDRDKGVLIMYHKAKALHAWFTS